MKPKSVLAVFLRVTAPLLIVFSVWWPEFNTFRIDRTIPSATTIEKLSGSASSRDLAEIASVDMDVSLGIPLAERATEVAKILSGLLNAPVYLPSAYPLQGWPKDLMTGSPTFQLVMASLAMEDLLLKEYESVGNRQYYLLARDRVLSFARWESHQEKPIAFAWNDHAIAARVSVLTRLWSHLRNDASTLPAQRQELIALVERSGEMLAKKSLFTVRTNHGVMQNLALLQISAAFPDLPNASEWRKLAMERLDLQLRFYVSDEGVVLEHSAGYHAFGNHLLGTALQLVRLNRLEPPQSWLKAYTASSDFLQILARPDGSLPLVGNTAGGVPESTSPKSAVNGSVEGAHLYPLSGYSVWWSAVAPPSQTVVAWAKHDRHGHKHADEPSIHFWSRGIDWITATGYWPYGARGFDQANGWLGSNAPHAKGEQMNKPRTVTLLGSAESGGIRSIEIENSRASGFAVRRQIIQLSSDQLLVLDAVRGSEVPVETLWTLDTRLTLQALGGQHFETNSLDQGYSLQIELARENDKPTKASLYKGSWKPFAGWVVKGNEPTPSSAMLVEQPPGDSLTATLFTVSDQSESRVIKLLAGAQPDDWTIEIQANSGAQRVQRSGERISVNNAISTSTLRLVAPPSQVVRQEKLTASMTAALEAYPPWRALGFYYQRIYMAVGAMWVAIEVALVLLARRRLRRGWMDVVVLSAWAGMGCWIHAIYLA